MTSKLDYLSDHLKVTRRKLSDARHGGIVLTGEELEAFIGEFDRFISLSIALENEVSKTWWNQRAAAERRTIADLHNIVVAQAVGAPDSNIVAFPTRPVIGGAA